ncbi:helix-turn-helix transcriptional regulator [Streptococcus hyointestinalis]|uniref:helix-turn-helix domain-containing protein n=1 Tax=Streptococcus hyointestinalis TaxID=1337 RepID=UPI0035168933
MIFAERLKEKRLEKGITQQEIADKLHVNRVTYTNWEKGNREPNFKNLIELANLLETTTDYLLGRSKTPHSEAIKSIDLTFINNFSTHELQRLELAISIKLQRTKQSPNEFKQELIEKYHLDNTGINKLNIIFQNISGNTLETTDIK